MTRRLQRDQAAGVDAQRLAGRERRLLQRAAGVDEHPAVALQALHDEALAAEQSDAEALVERDADGDTLGGAQERVLLADQLAAQLGQVERLDACPGTGRRRRRVRFCAASLWNTVMNSDSPVSRPLAGAEQQRP